MINTFVGGLTEEKIENAVCRMVDGVDVLFMLGKFDQKEYDKRMKEINEWSDKEYRWRQR